MRLDHFVRRHPLAVLSVIAFGFVVWVWQNSTGDQQPRIVGTAPNVERILPRSTVSTDDQPPQHVPPPPITTEERTRLTLEDTARVLPKLKPGMTRSEVEELVGIPAPRDTSAATVSDGRVTYHTTYEADLEPPSTVRPLRPYRPTPKVPDPHANGRTLITLEFDATKPGHPLLRVHYPDPLF